jgi:hypothetical protein
MAGGSSTNCDLNLQAKASGSIYLRTNNTDIITIAPTLTTISSNLQINGNVGVGTNNANCKLDVLGAFNIRGETAYSLSNSFNNANGCLTIGDITKNYGGQMGWASNMGVLMECLDKTEIAIFDVGYGLVSAMQYSNNQLTFGRNMNYGTTKCYFKGGFQSEDTSTITWGSLNLLDGSVRIGGTDHSFYFNDGTGDAVFSSLGLAGSTFYSTSANVGDLVLRANTNKRLLLQSGGNDAHMIIDASGNTTLNSPTTTINGSTVYIGGNIIFTGTNNYIAGGINLLKRIYYTQAPMTPYYSLGNYRVDVYPANVFTIGAGSIRYFNLCWYSSTVIVTSTNFPYGSMDIIWDYSNNTVRYLPIYNNTNTSVDFANIASGYCTIYWTSPLTGLVVHLRPINTY